MNDIKTTALTLILLTAIIAPRLSHSQNPPSILKDWQAAAKLADSVSPDDWKVAESYLRLELGKASTPGEAAWALALFCVHRNDGDDLDRVLGGIAQRFPSRSASFESALSRLLVWRLIADPHRDKAALQTNFQQLVDEATASQNTEDGVLTCYLLGSTLGMFELDIAESPFAPELVHEWKQELSTLPQTELRNAFLQSFESSLSRANTYAKRLDELRTMGLEQARMMLTASQTERDQLDETLKAERLVVDQLQKSNEARTKELQTERKRIEAELSKISREWKQSTPGHPGAERPPPIEPRRADIFVDPVYIIWEWITDSQGNRVKIQRTIAKTYSEIEAEREDRFRGLMNDYRQVKAQYDRYYSQYRRSLDAWSQSDQARRDKLQRDRADAEKRLKDTQQELGRLKTESDEAGKLITAKANALKKLSVSIELDELLLPRAEANDEATLFSTKHFDLLNYGREKRRLIPK